MANVLPDVVCKWAAELLGALQSVMSFLLVPNGPAMPSSYKNLSFLWQAPVDETQLLDWQTTVVGWAEVAFKFSELLDKE